MQEESEITDPQECYGNSSYIKEEDSDSSFVNLREQLLKHVNSEVVEER
jgi:hypothetical protein